MLALLFLFLTRFSLTLADSRNPVCVQLYQPTSVRHHVSMNLLRSQQYMESSRWRVWQTGWLFQVVAPVHVHTPPLWRHPLVCNVPFYEHRNVVVILIFSVDVFTHQMGWTVGKSYIGAIIPVMGQDPRHLFWDRSHPSSNRSESPVSTIKINKGFWWMGGV